MQKSYDLCFPCESDYDSLKDLWNEVFGDSYEIINNFFKKNTLPENTICIKASGTVLSALYIIDSVVKNGGKNYKAMYIYAVATRKEFRSKGLMTKMFEFLEEVAEKRGVSYIFLVPESEGLFKMYEKQGFKTCFYYKKTKIINKFNHCLSAVNINNLSFDEYMSYREKNDKYILASLCRGGFDSFYNPVESEVAVFSVEGKGYCVAEISDTGTEVIELFGDEEILLCAVFSELGGDSLTLREYAIHGGVPYGMVKVIDNSPEINNGFFGLAYGG